LQEAAEAGALLAAALLELPPDYALLHKTRNKEQLNLHFAGWLGLDAVKGPSAYRRVWVRADVPANGLLKAAIDEHRQIHRDYRETVRLAREGEPAALELGRRLAAALSNHMAWEEAELYPRLSEFLGEARFVRELGYEHQGLRAALARWPDFLAETHAGNSTRKQIDRFELDLLHLFEHHIEREEEAAYPILERLAIA
jgi:hemerythrin-like domain-containing protein